MLPILSGGRLQMLVPWKLCSATAAGRLNAKITSTRIGRYKNPYRITAHPVNAYFAFGILRTEPLFLRREQDVDDNEDRQRGHQRDRERGTERLVLRLAELIPDQVPDELVLPAAQDVRDDVLARHRDEHQQGP